MLLLAFAPLISRAGDDSKKSGLALVEKDGGRRVTLDGKEVLTYNGPKTPLPAGFEPQYQRGGYISPVYTPSGKLVTDDYPPNHKHHHGIWSPWTATRFEGRSPDFWNMGQKTGTVEFVKFGPVAPPDDGSLTFTTFHRMVDLTAKPDPKAALNERWNVTVYDKNKSGDKPANVFDLAITQTCATDSPLMLPKYYYGGLGFRGHRDWNGEGDKCRFLTSEGRTRKDGNETTARWCWVGGTVDGSVCGVTILCHPSNFRAPQPVRLHPSEPFFCYAPQQAGDFSIEPGKPYVARYRFVVADGEADKALIERLYEDFAKAPAPKLEPATK
jgi:hypothetical protein